MNYILFNIISYNFFFGEVLSMAVVPGTKKMKNKVKLKVRYQKIDVWRAIITYISL